jgi:hypothetical protein
MTAATHRTGGVRDARLRRKPCLSPLRATGAQPARDRDRVRGNPWHKPVALWRGYLGTRTAGGAA